jgi:deoxyhypusine synthase
MKSESGIARKSSGSRSRKADILSNRVNHFDAESVEGISGVLEALNGTAFQSRNLAACFDVLMKILTDTERPLVFFGLAGAMIPAGMRKIIRDLVKLHVVDVLVSTGANLYHDVYEALGNSHYLAQHHTSDVTLRSLRVNRMLDVYADDEAFDVADEYIAKLADKLEPRTYSSREFIKILGDSLSDDESIVKTAAEEGVPIFCPSLADSSIGIALTMHRSRRRNGVIIDVIRDNLETMKVRASRDKAAGVYVAGGVPKNYIQQITPMGIVLGMQVPSLSYGIMITTDDPKWGGLSGCTFEESQSWGKYHEGANFATAYLDATIALPLLLRGIIERKSSWYPRKPLRFDL